MGLRHLHHGALGHAESLPALPDPVRISGVDRPKVPTEEFMVEVHVFMSRRVFQRRN